jgi:hypothetical protein
MRTSRSLSIVFCLAFCTALALRAEAEREEVVFEVDVLLPEAGFLLFDVLPPDAELLLPAVPVPEDLFLFFAPDEDEVPVLVRDVLLFVFCAIGILCVCPSNGCIKMPDGRRTRQSAPSHHMSKSSSSEISISK